jgi:hypothetical protein
LGILFYQILKKNLFKADAVELEIILIAYYGRMDLGLGCLVNMTNGGDGTSNKSPETRKKISEGQKGDKNHMFGKFGELNGNFGNRWNDDQKANLSKKLKEYYANHPEAIEVIKNRDISSETRRRISENANKPCNCDHYLSKEVIHIYTGIVHCSSAEAADTYGFKRSTLKSMLNGSNPNWTDLRYVESL